MYETMLIQDVIYFNSCKVRLGDYLLLYNHLYLVHFNSCKVRLGVRLRFDSHIAFRISIPVRYD